MPAMMITLNLTTEQRTAINRLVKSGKYSSREALILHALGMLLSQALSSEMDVLKSQHPKAEQLDILGQAIDNLAGDELAQGEADDYGQ